MRLKADLPLGRDGWTALLAEEVGAVQQKLLDCGGCDHELDVGREPFLVRFPLGFDLSAKVVVVLTEFSDFVGCILDSPADQKSSGLGDKVSFTGEMVGQGASGYSGSSDHIIGGHTGIAQFRETLYRRFQ